jgi:TRAP-type C4-dicarboxylate transport system substrate-binding protein
MTKKILFILLALVLALSLSLIGCTQEGQQEEEEEEEPEVLELVLSDHNPPFAAPNPSIVAYGAYIEEHSNGKVTVEVHTGGELYTDVELFPAVKAGAVDGGNYVPEIGDGLYYCQVMNLPFMGFTSQQMVDDIFWDLVDTHPEIMEDFTSQGLVLANVVTMPGYNLHFYNEGLVVDEPDDLFGFEICAMEGNLITILEYIPGVTGIQIAFPDLHPSFTAGLGNGFAQHNAFQIALGTIDYFFSHTITNIIYTPIGVLWNKESYDACVDLVGQSVMDAAAQVYADTFYPMDAETLNAFDATVADRGDTVTVLDATQLAAFNDLMTPWIDDWINGADDPATAQALYEDCAALIAAY